MRKKLAGFKIPKTIERIVELPKTPSGKVLKKRLRDIAKKIKGKE